ncbi:MAG: carboxymuconolactone decarboxylase family protein [Magnetospirillum sp.]|nr:carboxymuconolactone decarboxylase family protein [Magnetospirillum sp.]
MSARFDLSKDAPKAYQALYNVTNVLGEGSLSKQLKHLIDLRVSQLNGCTYCIDLHTGWARGDGETDERLAAVAGWRQSPLFTPDEKAALAWAEALTERRKDQIDDLHAQLGQHFDRAGIGELTMMVAVVNAWNRAGIAFHRESAQAA